MRFKRRQIVLQLAEEGGMRTCRRRSPDRAIAPILQTLRREEDHRDHEEAEKGGHRRGDVLMTDPV
jgi:hypothetical protein